MQLLVVVPLHEVFHYLQWDWVALFLSSVSLFCTFPKPLLNLATDGVT